MVKSFLFTHIINEGFFHYINIFSISLFLTYIFNDWCHFPLNYLYIYIYNIKPINYKHCTLNYAGGGTYPNTEIFQNGKMG